ncbi:hypothetical protein BRARA_F01885 [Brassica rapa]|uniref:DUF4283 domain-containing protein n=1 Tax=Brassica campestris TaxID=3711 RepID=A0A397YZ22_BRACM|nr:hypothetical protein BRARA_F01885 [Brassica rapa]
MGSSYRNRSAHMADIKGKGILYEDDDEPIKLTSQGDSTILDEFSLSLIGKIPNPKKQNVEKLLQKMPSHWGLADRITANDLGNGKFLFNFTTEEDLQSVLCKGPFHFNFCMVVLVRWEPIVHDDYPWIIPFWVRLIGIPLHLWTENNLRNIGSRLGHVDKVEHTEGRMLIGVDTRRPLKFTRKAESPEGDEVTLEIKYEMLFKHCSTCGMLTHEKEYCPSLEVKNRLQPQTERHDLSAGRYKPSRSSRYDSTDRKRDEETNHRHSDRIMRRRDEHSRNNRYGGSRVGTGPYDRKPELTWRQKPLGERNGNRVELGTNSCDVVPYEQSMVSRSDGKPSNEEMRSPELTVTRRLASTIITPSRADIPMEENVTKRAKEATRSLSFTALSDQELQDGVGNGQIIGALSDMEIADPHDGEMMDYDVSNDDLLGLELTEMGSGSRQDSTKEAGISAAKVTRSRRQSVKTNVSLGIPSKKFGILRRGSPRKRSTSSHSDVGKSRRQHQSSKKHRGGSSTSDGLMGSKNSSHDQI